MKMYTTSFLLKLLSFAIPLHTSYSLGPNDTAECYAHPDPHIKTFDGISYDYQHGCDVELVDAPGIKIQLRLKKYQVTSPTFSSIERLAINFPQTLETLEIDSYGDHFLNPTPGNPNPPNPGITMIGGYSFTKTYVQGWTSYMIDLSPQGHFIEIVDLPPLQEAGGLGIFIRGHGSLFYNAVGLCGKWNAPTPGLYNRVGVDMLPLPLVNFYSPVIDGSLFGDNWQVGLGAQGNFITTTGLPFPGLHAEFPSTCVARRRLQKEERALQNTIPCDYCRGLDNLVQRANCEYDFSVTQDCEWLKDLPFYKKEDVVWYEKETCCVRSVSSDVGYAAKDAKPDEFGSFMREACKYGTGDSNEDCYRKKKCDSTGDGCKKLVECQGGGCFVEVECFKKCVLREQAKTGYKLSSTNQNGYFYDKCPHNDSCKEIKTCNGSNQKECYIRKECSVDSGDEFCYRDVPCPCDAQTSTPSALPTVHDISSRSPSVSPTEPTDSPTSSPSTSPTDSPTSSPSASPTESPIDDQSEPWKCIGCEWMHSIGKVIPSGEDTCDISMKVRLNGRDGICKDNDDGTCKDTPCKYKYQVEYSIKPKCKESCVLIVSDAYTSGTTPTSPIVIKIKKNKGTLKQKKWKKVKCLCKTNTSIFKFQCDTGTGKSSKSVQVDYTCSECDMAWLPPDEL
jgi:hypothetical protein